MQLAQVGQRVLLVSTDPASNVGQVFGISIGNHITAVPRCRPVGAGDRPAGGGAGLPRPHRRPGARVLPDDVVRGIEEQLSGACTTEIAAFDEFTALLDRHRATDYDHIIFDTAPTGHTIRLLQLPGAWSGFLEEGKGDASCLGPLAGLEKQRSQYKAAVDALADPAHTRLVLVARAQQATLREGRPHPHRAGRHRPHAAIPGHQRRAARRRGRSSTRWPRPIMPARAGRPGAMPVACSPRCPATTYPLKPFNLVGLDALRQLLTDGPPSQTRGGRAPGCRCPAGARAQPGRAGGRASPPTAMAW
jgi:arsenite-transporting ATPase